MSLIDSVIADLKRHEGFVPHAYTDSLGYLTIGYGRLIDKRKGGRIREPEGAYLLGNDVTEVCGELYEALPWVETIDDLRKGVLINMGFNLGVSGLLKFKNTLQAVKEGRYEAAQKGMLQSLWAKQVGKRATELAERMRTGK